MRVHRHRPRTRSRKRRRPGTSRRVHILRRGRQARAERPAQATTCGRSTSVAARANGTRPKRLSKDTAHRNENLATRAALPPRDPLRCARLRHAAPINSEPHRRCTAWTSASALGQATPCALRSALVADTPQLPVDPERPRRAAPGAGSSIAPSRIDPSVFAFAVASVPLALIGHFSMSTPGALLGLLAAAALALGVMVWRLARTLRDPLERVAPPPTYVKDRDAALRYAEMVLHGAGRSPRDAPSVATSSDLGSPLRAQTLSRPSSDEEGHVDEDADPRQIALRDAKLARLRQPFSLRAALEHLELLTQLRGELAARDDALAAIRLAIHTGQLKCAVDLWSRWSEHLDLGDLPQEQRSQFEQALRHHGASSPNLSAVSDSEPASSPSSTNKSP